MVFFFLKSGCNEHIVKAILFMCTVPRILSKAYIHVKNLEHFHYPCVLYSQALSHPLSLAITNLFFCLCGFAFSRMLHKLDHFKCSYWIRLLSFTISYISRFIHVVESISHSLSLLSNICFLDVPQLVYPFKVVFYLKFPGHSDSGFKFWSDKVWVYIPAHTFTGCLASSSIKWG